MFKRFTPVTHSNIWTRPRGAPSATRFIGTSVIGVMRQGPVPFVPRAPRSIAVRLLFPAFRREDRGERRSPRPPLRVGAPPRRRAAPWHLLYDLEVSKCRSSGPCDTQPREFPPRNAPLISLSTRVSLSLSLLSFRPSAFHLPPRPSETTLRHSSRDCSSKIDRSNKAEYPRSGYRRVARRTPLPGRRSTTPRISMAPRPTGRPF